MTDKFEKLINEKIVTRLRDIHQLGFAYLDFEEATHCRYAHSIGTMEKAEKIATSINLSKDDIEKVKFTAILHEIGTAPYSYSITENVCRKLKFKKDEKSAVLIKDPITGINKILGPNVYEIASIVQRNKKGSLLDQVVFGSLGANVLDFLEMDSNHTGVPLISKDLIEFIIKNLRIGTTGNLELNNDYREILLIIHSAIKLMNHNVYFSPKRRIADKMLSKVVEQISEIQGFNKHFHESSLFFKFTDKTLFNIIRQFINNDNSKIILDMLEAHEIYESIDITKFILSRYPLPALMPSYEEIEQQICTEFSIPFCIVDSPNDYIVRYHGQIYDGESAFQYSLPRELLTFSDLFSEPLINRSEKMKIRKQLKWFLYINKDLVVYVNEKLTNFENNN